MHQSHTASASLVQIIYAGRTYGPVTSVASYSGTTIRSQFVTTAENMDTHLTEGIHAPSTDCMRKRLFSI